VRLFCVQFWKAEEWREERKTECYGTGCGQLTEARLTQVLAGETMTTVDTRPAGTERVTDMRVATMDARSPAIRVMNFGGEVIIQRIYVLESNGSASVALHRILTRFVLAPFYCKNKFLLTVSRDYTVEPY